MPKSNFLTNESRKFFNFSQAFKSTFISASAQLERFSFFTEKDNDDATVAFVADLDV